MENNEFKRLACTDVLSFLENKTTKDAFVKSYKQNASKSSDYANTVSELMKSGIDKRYYRKVFATDSGISEEECGRLFTEQEKSMATEKIVNALFDVAYTRIPNNEIGGDGKPASYDRRFNPGTAAERALLALSSIKEYSPEMEYLRTEYAYPREAQDFKVKNSAILESIKQDYSSCVSQNTQLFSRGFCNS